MYASEYQIEVYGADNHDMMDIVAALVAANVSGDNRDEIGMYLRDGKANSVFVDPEDLSEAVAIINGLGFETDEDEIEDEEIVDFDTED